MTTRETTIARWTVEIVRLPLPAAPIGEFRGTGATLSSPQNFPTFAAAINYARNLVQQGHGLHMAGPDGQDWDHRQIVVHINAQAMKRAALRAEDGATFCGRVDPIVDGQFCARCNARLDGHSEEPEQFVCDSRDKGIAWIEQQAAVRGFDRWYPDAMRD